MVSNGNLTRHKITEATSQGSTHKDCTTRKMSERYTRCFIVLWSATVTGQGQYT
jgi:hypothetical protein